MFYDEHGCPKEQGATSMYDSARLIGLMAVTNFRPNGMYSYISTDQMLQYVKYNEDAVLVMMRHPYQFSANNWKNSSRDQLIPYIAGLWATGNQGTARKLYFAAQDRFYRAQNTEEDDPGTVKKFPSGADILTPSHMNHLRVCSGIEPTITGKLWLMVDIISNGLFMPMDEPNQLISMCIVAGPKYVRMWKRFNKKWRESIRTYWGGWRGEPEFGEHVVDFLERY